MHGVAGGVLAELQGGEFRHGFVSVAATKLMDVNGMFEGMGMESADYAGLRVLTAALIGGTISEHTGGKFANGAATAAIAQIYNGNPQLAEELAQEGQIEKLMQGNAADKQKAIELMIDYAGYDTSGIREISYDGLLKGEGEYVRRFRRIGI